MFQLPEQTLEIQQAAKEFAQDYVLQGAKERDLSHEYPSEIVEMMGVISLFGYLNRWNDSMGTNIEDGAVESAEKYLGEVGWEKGKHDGSKY